MPDKLISRLLRFFLDSYYTGEFPVRLALHT